MCVAHRKHARAPDYHYRYSDSTFKKTIRLEKNYDSYTKTNTDAFGNMYNSTQLHFVQTGGVAFRNFEEYKMLRILYCIVPSSSDVETYF